MGSTRIRWTKQELTKKHEEDSVRIVDLREVDEGAGAVAGLSQRAVRAKKYKRRRDTTSGKERRKRTVRRVLRRDDDSDDNDEEGGENGAVLSMSLIGDSIYSPNYVVQVSVGSSSQTFHLQVDTGSSDLWIASNQCSSAACTNNKPPTYNPSASSSSVNTNVNFDINYLSGEVAGPIYWDSFALGPYEIGNQALAAATTVVNESLGSDFSGILGLALPLNSIIQQRLPAGVGDGRDGASVMSNLFGMTPTTQAPAHYFHSLLLERPGTDRVPSLLGIGRHPSGSQLGDDLELDIEKLQYSGLVSESDGVHYWKAELRAISVYINGTRKEVDIGNSASGSVFPQAILDTGVPYIVTTSEIANAIWGAIGISPANDGNYYLPCTTPLNMTITLDNRTEIPLHPLDLSAVTTTGSSCIGLIQANSGIRGFGDIILGVPFLRNVYSVMAYEPVQSDGTIGNAGDVRNSGINPQLGLLNLTDPATALEEFHKVRVLNEPLGSSNSATLTSGEKLSVGVKVLFGLIGFVVLCGILFGIRYFFQRRQAKRIAASNDESSEKGSDKEGIALTRYDLVPRVHSYVPSEDTQRTLTNVAVADPTSRLEKKYDSVITKVGADGDEFGYRKSRKFFDSEGSGDEVEEPRDRPRLGDDSWEPHSSWIDPYSEFQEPILGEWRPPPPTHERSYSSSSVHSIHAPSAPLLNQSNLTSTNHDRSFSADSTGSGERTGTPCQVPMTLPVMPLQRNVDEFGGLVIDYSAEGMTMSGSAARRPRLPRANTAEPAFRASHPGSLLSMNTTQSGQTRPQPPRRNISGPRPASTMSRVVNADDLT